MPYILLLLFSCIGNSLVFDAGLNRGDDYYFHTANMLDEYQALLDGKGFLEISGNLATGLGIGKGLFYSPLSHLTVALVAVCFRVFGLSLVGAYKLVLVGSVFLSGVFAYRFASRFTKGNTIASLLAGACFVLYPYRAFDAFCRLAFAEAFCFPFLPLFFMGLYDIVHLDGKTRLMPFIEVAIGGAMLYLSHNITALYAYVFGALYLLVGVRAIFKQVKNWRFWTYACGAIVLLIGLTAVTLFTQMELLSTKIYTISDGKSMWTDVETVVGRTGEQWDYSGFLNIVWLSKNGVKPSLLYTGIILYIVGCALCVVADVLLEKVRVLRKYYLHRFIAGAVLFVIVSLTARRLEVYLGAVVFYVLYLVVAFAKDTEQDHADKLYKNALFWYALCGVILLLVAMQSEGLWKIVPQAFRNIQFPWRLWALVQLFASVLVGLLAHYYGNKRVAVCALATVVGLCTVTNMASYEKRVKANWETEITELYYDKNSSIGHNKEYCPLIFRQSDYVPKYAGSLYYAVKARLHNVGGYDEYSVAPVVLTGQGTIVVNERFAPKYDMQITVTQDALIQMPLLYYPGYAVQAMDEDGNTQKIAYENVDGLITFTLSAGTYKVRTAYEGTTARKVGAVYTGISAVGIVVALGFAIATETELGNRLRKRKKKEENE
ncbi:MAG: hypothetical protein IJ996_00400 [Clostridia bacterium]|nr:hypothetical protein [Clostridia bacterium]